jgi:hypothetical protein
MAHSTRFAETAAMLARLAALALLLVCLGCAALTQLAPLYPVEFAIDRVSDVKIAGIALAGKTGYADLGPDDVARLAGAVASRNVPLDLIVHISATSPGKNMVNARVPQIGWWFYLDEREIVKGMANRSILLEPGKPLVIPIAVHFDAYDQFGGRAKSLFELALAIADVPGYSKEVRFDIQPVVETGLGPILYPQPITLRRTVGG